MKRYFFVFYIGRSSSSTQSSQVTGSCTIACNAHKKGDVPFLNRLQTEAEIVRMCKNQGHTVSDIILTGYNELTENEFSVWNQKD